MKWFIVLLVIVGGYYFILMASTSMVLNSTQQLQYQYAHADDLANQIASNQYPNNR